MGALIAFIAIVSYNNLAATAVLPAIGDDLGQINLLPWVITIELLTSAVAVLAVGPIVDSMGVRKTARLAGIGFIFTSVLVVLAPSMFSLIAARACQGVFAGAALTVATTGIGVGIPTALRPRAFAVISTVWGVMGVAGPALAAALVAFSHWRATFMVNVLVATIALLVGWSTLPDNHRNQTRRPPETATQNQKPSDLAASFDGIGLFLIAAITAAVLTLTANSVTLRITAAVTIVCGCGAYRYWAQRNPQPILRLHHLSSAQYRSIHLTSMLVLAAGVGINSLLPLYLRAARQTSTTLAASSVLFLTVGWTAGAWLSSRLQDRWHAEKVSLIGSLIAFPAAVSVAVAVTVQAPLSLLFVAFTVLGVGVGSITSTGAALLQNRTQLCEMGRLNGAHQFVRTTALTFGIAAVAAIAFGVVDMRIGDIEAVRGLLSDDPNPISADIISALGDGFALATIAAAVIAAFTVPSARYLYLSRDQGFTQRSPT